MAFVADAELIKLMVTFSGVQRDKGRNPRSADGGIRTRREADFTLFKTVY